MSEYRIEKLRNVKATIVFISGPEVRGTFFLAEAVPDHAGPERVFDILNRPERFFPFEIEGQNGRRPYVALYARAHVLLVKLDSPETESDVSLELTSDRTVSMLLTNGERLRGEMHVATPDGTDRVSDFANREGRFQYFGARTSLSLVNVDHVVEILPISE